MTQATPPHKGEFRSYGVSRENRRVSEISTYAMAPQLRARIMGAALMVIGLVLAASTLAIAVFKLSLDLLVLLIALVLVAIFGLGFLLVRRWYVVRMDDLGYRVRFVRGAGVDAARWADVKDVQTADVGGARCVVLQLRSGDTTTIPVDLVAGGPGPLVEDLRRRLNKSNGISPVE